MRHALDILLIEDSRAQARLYLLLLQRAGYRVLVAADGTTGCREAATRGPRLIILDVNLPDIDGFAVLQRLKTHPDTAAIPVLMLTHRAHVSDVLRALELRADDYLTKQDATVQLLDAVSQLLHAAPVTRR